MKIKRFWVGNKLRNYNYLVYCASSGEAIAIDPLDWQQILDYAEENKIIIKKIINTHEHPDHIGGNENLVKYTKAEIYAHPHLKNVIRNLDYAARPGIIISAGKEVKLRVLETPGHTKSHICLLDDVKKQDFFCGDTIFNAGVGHCKRGGDVNELFSTIQKLSKMLSDNVVLHPGHDYILNNLKFANSIEPNNNSIKKAIARFSGSSPESIEAQSLSEEKEHNPFLRLNSEGLLKQMKEKNLVSDNPSKLEVFRRLRSLRDNW